MSTIHPAAVALTTKQLLDSGILPVSISTLRRLMDRPVDGLPFRKIGTKNIFIASEVQAWLIRQDGFNLDPTPSKGKGGAR